ncbi:MAG: Nif11-like leader peptide family natural product precursor [Rhodoblastus sp.]|nr:Nif11-like leader peptide family natural product precursor [Rhodoblastus sp.]
MSTQAVLQLFKMASANADLRKALSEIGGGKASPTPEDMQQLVEVAKAHGASFTIEEYAQVRNNPPGGPNAVVAADAVPYECTSATAWKGHPPDPDPGCTLAWGCGVDHTFYGGPHIPKCTTRPV